MTRKVFFTRAADGRAVATPAYSDRDPEDDTPGGALSGEVSKRYQSKWGPGQVLDVFRGQNDFWYLFDSSPSGRTDFNQPANRVLAAWGYAKPDERVGDRRRLRRFPVPADAERSLDRGHLIALASGGGENVNIVPQASRLNRGHSTDGKRWRALERLCASTPGIFMFLSLEYDDVTDVPSRFRFQVMHSDGTAASESFDNVDCASQQRHQPIQRGE